MNVRKAALIITLIMLCPLAARYSLSSSNRGLDGDRRNLNDWHYSGYTHYDNESTNIIL